MATAPATASPIAGLQALGQATWLDFMSRELLDSGGLKRLIDEDNLQGVTSNPTIFEKAIREGHAYDAQIRELVRAGADDFAIYDALTTSDIRRALDHFLPMYEQTDGLHGFVSLEVDPRLAHDTARSAAEAKRLWAELDRPNAMIKIPGTPEGLPAIEECLFDGLNINITLLFSVAAYERVARTYVRALARRVEAGRPIHNIASVASFFVSRIDAEVDKRIDERLKAVQDAGQRRALEQLKGKIAIANAKNAYTLFLKIIGEPEFQRLRAEGARVQRVLWASVGAKNPAYPDTLYVDELIGPDTVSTMPPETFEAFKDHGRVAPTLERGMDEAPRQVDRLRALGIDLDDVTELLLRVGVERFSNDFTALIEGVGRKRAEIAAEQGR
jgi:transaldolase/glucose-6-phosphate isomerase